jgi:hypothetical protein
LTDTFNHTPDTTANNISRCCPALADGTTVMAESSGSARTLVSEQMSELIQSVFMGRN